ncbi:hypothetical protein LCGC14_2613760 [marine sediment metagenome]|uniref:Uncharacterized protein n=1 Tax=marine sediment metagenome TaxID=412755 RepID=A0A0F9CXS0_9ZZZZ
MKRNPTEEDARVLQWAGVLGHRFVQVDGEDGSRRVRSEQNTDEIDPRYGPFVDPKVYEQIRFVSRKGRRWRRVR